MSAPIVTLEDVEPMIPKPQPTFGPDGMLTECRCRECRTSIQAKALVRAAARVVEAARKVAPIFAGEHGATLKRALTDFDKISKGKQT